MDENGVCRDKTVDLEHLILSLPTFSKITAGNIDGFEKEVRDLLISKDIFVYEWDKKTGYNPLYPYPFRLSIFERNNSRKIEYRLTLRTSKVLVEVYEYSIRISLSDNPKYALVRKEDGGKGSGVLCLSTKVQNMRRTYVYYAMESVKDSNRNNNHPALTQPNKYYMGISKQTPKTIIF
ncbi:hypothetical protein HYW20_06995 [Candidatus Woesearchaeota archaeon]|nr:hypothetical protein [Candidatus Woesearchaeota archaeon]